MVFATLDYVARGLMALQAGYNIYDKIQKDEYKTSADVAEIAFDALNVGAVGAEVIALNQTNRTLFGFKERTFTNTARVAAAAKTVIQVSRNKEIPPLSKGAKIASRLLINIAPVVEFEQEACQAIGVLVAGADEWYFRSRRHVRKQENGEQIVEATRSDPENDDEIIVDIPMGFDEWVRGQVSCQDKICRVSQLYMFNVMRWKADTNFCVDQRHLQSCEEKGVRSFRFEGKVYKLADFERDSEESRENCRYYLNVIYPAVVQMTQKNTSRAKKARAPQLKSKQVKYDIRKNDSKQKAARPKGRPRKTQTIPKKIVKEIVQRERARKNKC